LNHRTIRTRIVASFALILAIMLATAGIAYKQLSDIDREVATLRADALPGLESATVLRGAWSETYVVNVRLATATTDAERTQALTRLEELRERLDAALRTYGQTEATAEDRSAFERFQQIRQQYEQSTAALRDAGAARAGAIATVPAHGPLLSLWEEGHRTLQQLVDDNKRSASHASGNIIEAVDTAKNRIEIALVVAIVAAVVAGYLLFRYLAVPMRAFVGVLRTMRGGDLRPRLALGRGDEFGQLEEGFNQMTDDLTALVGQAQRSAIQVTTSVNQIAATARQQQATATETAATTTEIGATSREIAATSRDLVRTMNEVSQAAEQTAGLAGTGQASLTRMETTMHQVMDAAGSVNAKLAALTEKAGNISQVVTTIAKVADQTNLLSLNAAIEAEKAGEYGRGFSVVATEIRRLADQTAVATYDIGQIVREIQSAVSASVMGMDKFAEEVRRGMAEVTQVGDQLSQIIGNVQQAAPRVQMVNEGMQAQSTGAEQINQALMQLSEAARQSVESLRQSSQALDELTLVANDLRTGVSRFQV
jgi:methyl-accepting chemotaxis protein WspA